MKIYRFIIGSIVIAIVGGVQPSYAVIAGCDAARYTAIKQISEVRTTYDVGATEQTTPKPDSVLALSCFSQASQTTAEQSGAIFSDPFQGGLNDTLQGTTNDMADNFSGGLMDKYTMSTAPVWSSGATGSFSCDNMANVWGFAQSDTISTEAEFMDMDQILSTAGGTPSSGAIMDANLTTISSATTAGASAYLSAPPTVIPVMNADANANGYLDTCDVMRNLAGAPVASCP